jgi:hypothetical protein
LLLLVESLSVIDVDLAAVSHQTAFQVIEALKKHILSVMHAAGHLCSDIFLLELVLLSLSFAFNGANPLISTTLSLN